jgi:predicted oxidoreductase
LVGKSRSNTINHYSYSKEYIIWSAEESLRNLKTAYIDTFLLHRPSPLMHPNEIAAAVLALQESGKIINFGVSNFTPSQVALIENAIPVAANQIEFSLTQHTAMENGSLDQLLQKEIQPMSWSPLGSVFKVETAKTIRIKKVLKTLTKKIQVSGRDHFIGVYFKTPSKSFTSNWYHQQTTNFKRKQGIRN